MYDKIWNPYKLEFVSTFSIEGKKAIKAYVNSYMTGGASGNEKAEALKAAAAAADAAANTIKEVKENIGGANFQNAVANFQSHQNSLVAKLRSIPQGENAGNDAKTQEKQGKEGKEEKEAKRAAMTEFKRQIAGKFQEALERHSDKLYYTPKRRIIIDPTFEGKSLIKNPEDKEQTYRLQVYKIKEDKDDSMKAGYHENKLRLPGLDETGGPSDLRLNPDGLSDKINELGTPMKLDDLILNLKYDKLFNQNDVQTLKDYKYYKVDKSMNKIGDHAQEVQYYFHEEGGKDSDNSYKAYLLTGPEVMELVGGDIYRRGWAPDISTANTEQLKKAVTKIPLNDDGTLNVDRINTDFSDVLLKIYENDKVSA